MMGTIKKKREREPDIRPEKGLLYVPYAYIYEGIMCDVIYYTEESILATHTYVHVIHIQIIRRDFGVLCCYIIIRIYYIPISCYVYTLPILREFARVFSRSSKVVASVLNMHKHMFDILLYFARDRHERPAGRKGYV